MYINKIIINFDGSCINNPGGPASYGWTILIGKDLVEGSGKIEGVKKYTNNVAEYIALRSALEYLIKNDIKTEKILILGDSKLIINQISYLWKVKDPYLDELCTQCIELLEQMNASWESKWIPREENQRCDTLAEQAAKEENAK